MDDQPSKKTETDALAHSFSEIAEQSQRLLNDFVARQSSEGGKVDTGSMSHITSAFMEMTTQMMSNPAKLAEAQMSLWNDYMSLWQSTANRMMGGDAPDVVEPESGDRRFRDESWSENEVFNYVKQSYLLTSNWVRSTVADVEGLDEKTANKVDFFTRQYVNALSPSNFAATNPEVMREAIESKGETLVKGLKNLLGDLERGKGRLDITMTDTSAFTLGENVATTPGKVVFRNDLLELIQYAPATKTVYKTPLLIATPWINKYYILDLRPENSLIKWAVDQGHTVFITSWVNPDEKLAAKDFNNYMKEGVLESLDAIEAATGEKQTNVIGYCIGGTLLACTLAYLHGKKGADAKRIKSATYLTAMVDFSDPGELGIFIDEEQLADMDKKMFERGYLEGREMAATFNMMRDNDLIWSFVVNNYLLGKDPFPFDLLYWNSDSTRMPAAMHSFYLRKMYLENKLVEPGGIELDGVALDLKKIKTPSYMLSTRDDHIAPWQSTYAATDIYSGPIRFVLSASGHIAGVVNPPVKEKYCYWTNTKIPKNPEKWLDAAKQNDGSWWPDWNKWVAKHAGKKDTPARTPGDGKLKSLADAPGTYVQVRSQ
ncbi:MAG: class I poly(R)-hydroxyalkanoic acid synthase [Rhodospirillaceae bacterium]|nr:class I poly(R)-hydroxyalkanoic acid synthase [Rhodospirillaceae bacterium]